MKRLLDFTVALLGLVVASPILIVFIVLVWMQDWKSPFYMAPRVAQGGGTFRMVKLRSMVVNADRKGGSSTSASDIRITRVGKLIRKFKLDELTQLWNVLWGEMSLVGPRPQIWNGGVALYTQEEMRLTTVRPGITDFSSIVFSDEGDILAGRSDPDLAYNQLIRPWKSRFSLFYVDHSGVVLDIQLIWLTATAIFSKQMALQGVMVVLEKLKAPAGLIAVARRDQPLVPTPPPGADHIVAAL